MQTQLEQTQQLADWYREQCIKQDEQVSQLKEESSDSIVVSCMPSVFCF